MWQSGARAIGTLIVGPSISGQFPLNPRTVLGFDSTRSIVRKDDKKYKNEKKE